MDTQPVFVTVKEEFALISFLLYVRTIFVIPCRTFTTRTAPKRKSAWTATIMRTRSPKTLTPSTATATWGPDHIASECRSEMPSVSWKRAKRKACWENLPTRSSSTLPSNRECRATIATTPTPVKPTPSCQRLQRRLRGPIRIRRSTRPRSRPLLRCRLVWR